MTHNITPEKDLYTILQNVNTPGRYVGGEYGSIIKEEAHLRMAVCFPDLYEIGMSNLAIQILYRRLNTISGVSCERVFAPDFDFEKQLKEHNIPLYTLERGMPLKELDILGFSIGYELCCTNILAVLETGGIPVFAADRTGDDPIIIAGGPSIGNPLPLSPFIDCFFIGEAEESFEQIVIALREAKKKGATREQLLDLMISFDEIWSESKSSRAKRSVWNGFSQGAGADKLPSWIIPNVSVVHDHGVVDIMRGCPNGCRFCHAGITYRPFRMKHFSRIIEETDRLVFECGYRDITLSSLSSGDYQGIEEILDIVNSRYESLHVSFNLPSLKVESFTFPLLSKLSEIRKAGLTFAVETPGLEWQKGINKIVSAEHTINIINEAKKFGWRRAKFYFMIGMPFASCDEEADSIIAFLTEVQNQTGIKMSVNIGTFVPKPFTPFQWEGQLAEEKAFEVLVRIKKSLSRKFFNVQFHSPFSSQLEGIISRGDRRVGDLIYSAYKKGARMDAWKEHKNREVWTEVFAEADWDVTGECNRKRDIEKELPWDVINMGVSKKFLKEELEKAMAGELTSPCASDCDHLCGSCNQKNQVVDSTLRDFPELSPQQQKAAHGKPEKSTYVPVLFTFSKKDKALFYSHLNIMDIFEKALQRALLVPLFTEGFNPKPRIEFANPIALGIDSEDEAALVELSGFTTAEDFINRLSKALPPGISITGARALKVIEGAKKIKATALFRAAYYHLTFPGSLTPPEDFIEKMEEVEVVESVKEEEAGKFTIVMRRKKLDSLPGIKKTLEKVLGTNPLEAGIRITRTKSELSL